ncbi:MAG: iron ABC transporter permease [Clostridiales Family XIII bacterium]|jgi:iron complex transport system permease protein|nr:iron ABC transporter permease [Clostridiales Family XIII bacterium]
MRSSAIKRESFRAADYALFAALTLAVMLVCIGAGSVNVPLSQTAGVLWNALTGQPQPGGTAVPIILSARLPRVLCVALVGASLSIGGGAMQGLLKNPLADGTTLGVSGGASLGAVIAMTFGITIPGLPFAGTMAMAMLFAFLSLIIILSLAYRLDYSLSTNTIILLGVIYSMFVSSVVALLTTFAGERVRDITFWLMGSLAGSSYMNAAVLAGMALACGGVLLCRARELNAFAIGEDNARHVGVNVRRVKLTVLIAVAALIGVCVSVSGMIGFVGLVTPHMLRMVVGPNHKRLLPATMFGGACFLMLADLAARTILSPRELPIGVVTSFIGAIIFLSIFFRMRRGR